MSDTPIQDAVREEYGDITTSIRKTGCAKARGGRVLRAYRIEDARAFLAKAGLDVDRVAPEVETRFATAFVRARKPEAAACCGPDCCA